MNDNEDVPIRDAATVILLREKKDSTYVLMGQRGNKAVFMPSKYVFPGGCLLYTSPSPRDVEESRMPSSA